MFRPRLQGELLHSYAKQSEVSVYLTSFNEKEFLPSQESLLATSGTSLQLQNASFVAQTCVVPLRRTDFVALNCPSETPVSELNRYTYDIRTLHAAIAQAVNSIPAASLVMGPFARATNQLASYVNAMPGEFCIGPGNRNAFDQLQNALQAAVASVNHGNSIFEQNFELYFNRIVPLLNKLHSESNAISSTTRDFTKVIDAFQMYDTVAKQYQLDIWALTQKIANISSQLSQLVGATDAALNRAIYQIEANVEAEAQQFTIEQNLAEAAFRHWDTVDGKQGYDRYVDIMKRVASILIPAFNDFLRKVPATARIKAAVQRAQQSINQIDTGYASFPTLRPLGPNSTSLPHDRYGSDERKYGGAAVMTALASIAIAYQNRTKEKLHIGDMQYVHGGKMGKHRSHKDGIDADVDGLRVGNVPNHDLVLALALAKDILSSGARLVFYADQSTVNEANKWAASNGVSGRLQVESDHTNHFHLRMPW